MLSSYILRISIVLFPKNYHLSCSCSPEPTTSYITTNSMLLTVCRYKIHENSGFIVISLWFQIWLLDLVSKISTIENGQNLVHVVVECPLKIKAGDFFKFFNEKKMKRVPIIFTCCFQQKDQKCFYGYFHGSLVLLTYSPLNLAACRKISLDTLTYVRT